MLRVKRNTIILILLLTFSFTNNSCEKEGNNKPEIPEWSKVTAEKNGLKWETPAAAFKYKQDTVIVPITVLNKVGYLREALIISNLSISIKTHKIYKEILNSNQNNTFATYYTISDDGDVLEDIFNVLESQDNFIEIKTVNLTNMEMSGILQITFIRDSLDTVDNPSLGDTIFFKNGVFRIKIVE